MPDVNVVPENFHGIIVVALSKAIETHSDIDGVPLNGKCSSIVLVPLAKCSCRYVSVGFLSKSNR